MSSFWHWFIAIVTLLSIAACLWLLFANARGTPGEGTTGHVWDDDLREYNNPLPRWWLNLFVLTVVFAFGYLIVYPGLGDYTGTKGWSQTRELQEGLAAVQGKRQAVYASMGDRTVPDLAKDVRAVSLGKELFMANCAGCHGADARGAIGFPDLADQDWLYGGEPAKLIETITAGRHGQMPSFIGAMDEATLDDLVETLRHWSDSGFNASKRARGMKQFNITCAACHGPEGKGNPAMGTPNLTDSTWLHGGSHEQVRHSVLFGRQSNMPAQKGLLSDEDIRLVASYVHSLSLETP